MDSLIPCEQVRNEEEARWREGLFQELASAREKQGKVKSLFLEERKKQGIENDKKKKGSL